MPYIYSDSDNEPMNEENIQVEERDCEHCRNHDGKDCQVWDCKFEPKQLPAAKNCHERCCYSKECYALYHCKGSHDPSYPFECAIYSKLLDLDQETRDIPFFDPDFDLPEETEDDDGT